MPATTTAVNGCDVVVQLDDSGGVLTDISGSSNKVEMELDNDIGAFKVFGTDWRQRLACGKDASFSLDVVYSKNATEGLALLRGWYFGAQTARTLRVDVPDSTTGSDRYEAEVVLESLSIPATAEEAGPIVVTAELKPTGQVVHSTIP